MPNLKSPLLYKVAAFALAYAIFSAHRAGTPLAKIKQLLVAPNNAEGLTDFTLREKTSMQLRRPNTRWKNSLYRFGVVVDFKRHNTFQHPTAQSARKTPPRPPLNLPSTG